MSNDITGGLRNLKGGNIDALRGPYATVAAANLALPNTVVDGLNFREGKFAEVGVKPNLVTYWWKGGYADVNLVEYTGDKVSKSGVGVIPGNDQLFDKTSFREDTRLLSTGALSVITGNRTTLDIPLKAGKTHITSSGMTVGVNHIHCFVNNLNQVITPVPATFTTSSNTQAIPAGAKAYRLWFKNASEANNNALNTLMINYGQAALAYQNYTPKIETIEGTAIKNADMQLYSQEEVNALIPTIEYTLNSGVQVFNKLSNILADAYINPSTNQENVTIASGTDWMAALNIPCEPGRRMAISGWNSARNEFAVFGGIPSTNANKINRFVAVKAGGVFYFTPPEGAASIGLTVKSNTEDVSVFEHLKIEISDVVSASTDVYDAKKVYSVSKIDGNPVSAVFPNMPLKSRAARLQVRKDGNTLYIRSTYNATQDIVYKMEVANPNFQSNILGPILIEKTDLISATGSVLQTGADMTAPLQYEFLGNIAGNHGFQSTTVIQNAHGKTTVDIGSAWSDSTSSQFYLIKVIDVNSLVLLAKPYSEGGELRLNNKITGNTLTHVSGATHTSVINFTSSTSTQEYPVNKNVFTQLLIDNRKISADGDYYGDIFEVKNSFSTIDPTTLIISNPFNPLNGDVLADLGITYTFSYSSMLISYTLASKINHKILNIGMIQPLSVNLVNGATKRIEYIPGVKPKIVGGVTFDFQAKQDMTTGPANTIYLLPVDMVDPAKPANRMIVTTSDNTNLPIRSMAHGYNLFIGNGKALKRAENAQLWYISPENKSYPRLINNKMSENSVIYGSAYYTWFDPLTNPQLTACYHIQNGRGFLLFLDAHQNLNNYNVILPDYLTGLKIDVVESRGNMTLNTDDFVPANGLSINVTGNYGAMILNLQ